MRQAVAPKAAATHAPSRSQDQTAPASLPVPMPWTSAIGQAAYVSQCTTRQARCPSELRIRLVPVTAITR